MARRISAKVGQGIFLVFLHLLALRNSSRESFDAGHVRYPSAGPRILVSSEVVAANIQTRQRPLGDGVIIAISDISKQQQLNQRLSLLTFDFRASAIALAPSAPIPPTVRVCPRPVLKVWFEMSRCVNALMVGMDGASVSRMYNGYRHADTHHAHTQLC